MRNNYNKELKIKKTLYYRKLYEKYESEKDIKNVFKTTKKLLNWNSGGPPKSFLVDGILKRKAQEVADTQQNYFKNKIIKLMDKLRPKTADPTDILRKAIERWENSCNIQKFSFREVSTEDTLEFIGRLGNSTTYGNDNLDATSIKTAAQFLALPIKHLINTSLKTGRFANRWKLAKTIPLHKDKDLSKLDPASYRPIAILPTLSKISREGCTSAAARISGRNISIKCQ